MRCKRIKCKFFEKDFGHIDCIVHSSDYYVNNCMDFKEKKYNYYYYKQPISKSEFLKNVPENWEEEVKNFEYSWGGYRAILKD